jgi:hypothetical protein
LSVAAGNGKSWFAMFAYILAMLAFSPSLFMLNIFSLRQL